MCFVAFFGRSDVCGFRSLREHYDARLAGISFRGAGESFGDLC